MRIAAAVLLVSAVLVLVVANAGLSQPPQQVEGDVARPGDRSVPTHQLIALSTEGEAGYQMVTLVDPRTRTMAVYHVRRSDGEISLKAVRQIDWDLRMEEFNGVSPLPREIRAVLQQR